jgi:2'-5' RNA ligase
MSKRLFVAVKIKPSNKLISVTSKLQQNLQTGRIKWVATENLHVTLKFLGEVNDKLLPEIFIVLKNAIKNTDRFNIQIKGFGKFSRKGHTKVIWLGVEDSENCLASLATNLNNLFKQLHFKSDYKLFKPHLTVGRVKHIQDEHILEQLITDYSSFEIQKNTVEEIILFESILKSREPIYLPLQRIKLEKKKL